MADLFWLSNEQWAVIEPFMPKNQLDPVREDNRQIISGILHVLELTGILDRADWEATAWPLPWIAGRPDPGS